MPAAGIAHADNRQEHLTMQTWAKRGLQTALVTGGLLMLGTGSCIGMGTTLLSGAGGRVT